MTAATRITVGTTPAFLASAAARSGIDRPISVAVKNLDGTASIDLGPSGVVTGAGYPLAAGGEVGVDLWPGNDLWAVAASGTVQVAVLTTT